MLDRSWSSRIALALLILAALSCGDDDGGTDAGGRDGASPDGATDPGPHPCEALAENLDAIVVAAAEYEMVTRDPDVQLVAALMVRVAHDRTVIELTIAGLEDVLADPEDPVHATVDGADYLRGVIAEERTRMGELDAELMRLAARASEPGFELLDDPGGPERIVDAIEWVAISAEARDYDTRCDADRASLDADAVRAFIAGVGMMAADAEGGHETVRQRTVQRLLLEGGAP